jgi:ABC-type Zn uptake system ZnuABC Zn-binding protein ZnuA
MKMIFNFIWEVLVNVRLAASIFIIFSIILASCSPDNPEPASAETSITVLASTPFLADMAQNVAGDRLVINSLIPLGVDPHVFEPTPQDVAKVSNSQVLIINGAGFEEFIDNLLQQVQRDPLVIEASLGLKMRDTHAHDDGHAHDDDHAHDDAHDDDHAHDDVHAHDDDHDEHGHSHDGDPHFWLNPLFAIHYVKNIRDGLSEIDPEGSEIYAANADAYIARLQDLDRWISDEVSQIPSERRMLVTNHDSFGYFADQYGFEVTGTIIPSVHTGSSPSPQDMVRLIEQIRHTGAPAIFLETGVNPSMAEQIARETGIIIAPPLYSHSPSTEEGQAPDYISMMEYNTRVIVEALK